MRTVAVLAAAIACAPAGKLQSSRALAPGAMRVTVGSSVEIVDSGVAEFPVVEAGAGFRIGVVDRTEAGLAINGFWTRPVQMIGLLADAKVEALRGGPVSISPNPSFGWQRISGSGGLGHQLTASLPILVGIHFNDRHEAIAAPTILDQIAISDGASTVHQPFFGGAVGYRWQITRRFGLLPQVSAFYSPIGLERSGGTATISLAMGLLQDI
jgi:hypothetical protein